MKRKIFIGTLGAAVVLLSACSTDNEAGGMPAENEVTVSLVDEEENAQQADVSAEGENAALTISDMEGAAEAETDTLQSDTDSVTEAYRKIYGQIVSEKEGNTYTFTLIYLDEDDIPELVACDRGYDSYSVYTVKNGEAFCMVDSMITVELSYYERRGIICQFARWNGGGDEGGYGRYYYQVSGDKRFVDGDLSTLHYAYDAVYDEEGNWTGEGITKYYYMDQEIDEAAYQQMADDMGIIEGQEKTCLDNSFEKEEMLSILNGSGDTSREQSADEDADAARAAYYLVLDKLYTTYTLPDGTLLGYDGVLDLSLNQYAIYDIDQDGKDELIVVWVTTYTAGNAGIVYGFDAASGTVRTELIEYPMLTFYDNGVVEAGLSHNQGLAAEIPDFWPYMLYQYDKDTDTYVIAAMVDAWNKAYYEKDYEGNAFPDDIDADGDGIIYLVEIGDEEKMMDLEAYQEWRDSYVKGAKEIEIPFVGMKQSS